MKIAIAVVLQFLLFLFIFAVGSFLWHPFNLHWATTVSGHTTRYFIPDGLLLALGVFLAILAVQALRKRLCDSPWTILSFVLAVAIGYALKFGYATKDVF
jgi:cell division protein FtsW (lipid II flippase)